MRVANHFSDESLWDNCHICTLLCDFFGVHSVILSTLTWRTDCCFACRCNWRCCRWELFIFKWKFWSNFAAMAVCVARALFVMGAVVNRILEWGRDSPICCWGPQIFNPLKGTLKAQRNGPLYSRAVIDTLAVDGWAVTFGTARRGLGGLRPRPQFYFSYIATNIVR